MINARAFLGKEGFLFDKKSSQLDRLFLNEFPPEEAGEVRATWEAIHAHGIATTAVYNLPKTPRQANILFSHDRARYVATFDWLQSEIAHWQSKSIVEMGCGTGHFLRFVRTNFPEIRLKGLDAQENFISISRMVSGIDVQGVDYLKSPAEEEKFDSVICNFGFDLARFPSSTKPHSSATIGRSPYCPGCSDDFASQFEEYIQNWRAWGSSEARLFLTGRFPHFGHVRGVILAASAHGWELNRDRSRILKVKDSDGVEWFPAFVFTAGRAADVDSILADAERIFRPAC